MPLLGTLCVRVLKRYDCDFSKATLWVARKGRGTSGLPSFRRCETPHRPHPIVKLDTAVLASEQRDLWKSTSLITRRLRSGSEAIRKSTTFRCSRFAIHCWLAPVVSKACQVSRNGHLLFTIVRDKKGFTSIFGDAEISQKAYCPIAQSLCYYN